MEEERKMLEEVSPSPPKLPLIKPSFKEVVWPSGKGVRLEIRRSQVH